MDTSVIPPLHLASLENLQAEAVRFTKSLEPSATRATLITLSGELGAGKTSFTQGMAQAFGIKESVTSPTFVLLKMYELPEGNKYARLAHIDAYRLEGDTSLTPLGFDELYADAANLIVLEWPELVSTQLPKADVSITLMVEGEGRTISYA